MLNNKNEQKCCSCGGKLYQWKPGDLCICGECFYWDRAPKEDYHNEEGLRYDEGKHFDEGKLRVDLMSVDALRGLAEVLTLGCEKYDERNWQKGIKFSKLYGSALRHLFLFFEGKDMDEESKKLAIDHAQCCIHFLSHYLHNYEVYKEFDDRVNIEGGKYGNKSELNKDEHNWKCYYVKQCSHGGME